MVAFTTGKFARSSVVLALEMEGENPLHHPFNRYWRKQESSLKGAALQIVLRSIASKMVHELCFITLKQGLPCKMTNPHRQKHSHGTPERNSYDRPDRRGFTQNRRYIAKDRQ